MIITILVTALKTVAHVLLLALIPLQLLTFVLPSIVVDPVISNVSLISSLFVWLFGYEAYSFFVFTVVSTVFALPAYKLSLFFLHFMHKIKLFVR